LDTVALRAPALEVVYPRACPDLLSENVLPTFELEIASSVWRELQQDQRAGVENYHPVTFRYGGEVRRDAMIRLRGHRSHCGDKMQLAISFNEVDPGGRFHGQRRINVDHGSCHLLEERLALSYMRDLGLPAPCANHARIVVNGSYYGLYVNLEPVNKDFLKRNFAEHDGNLYKSGHVLKTNEEARDKSDVNAFWAARDVATLDRMTDLDEALLEWAAEAVLPARDNYWLKGWNYYLYHHPSRGFLFIPEDVDQGFPGWAAEVPLATLWPAALQPPADVVLADRAFRERFKSAVRKAITAFDVNRLEGRLDRWWSQIAPSAAADPHMIYTEEQARSLRERIRERARWLKSAGAQL
jgi:hypothetical protein